MWFFAATGVDGNGVLLDGVPRLDDDTATIEVLVMRSCSGTVCWVEVMYYWVKLREATGGRYGQAGKPSPLGLLFHGKAILTRS